MIDEPTLPAALDAVFSAYFKTVHTGMPGRVERVSSDGSSVDVQPMVKSARPNPAEVGDDVYEALPVIPAVPVVYFGGGGFVLTVPVAVGDTCWLSFAETSLARWKATGGLVQPEHDKRHGLDAVAILGLRSFSNKLPSVPTDRVALGAVDGIQVHVTALQVLLGGADATQAATLGTALASYLASVQAWMLAAEAKIAALSSPTVPPPPASLPTITSSTVFVKP